MSCWDRVKAGAVTGSVVGLCIGTLYGGFSMLTVRGLSAGQRVQGLAKIMTGSALSFGFFLAIGSAIRCEPLAPTLQDRKGSASRDRVMVEALVKE